MKVKTPDKETAATRARYERIAPVYDLMEMLPERRYTPWRKYLWSLVKGPKVLEVGVGTGRNMLLYPSDIEITAIDLTPGMLVRAKRRASELGLEVDLRIGDVQNMEFPDDTFDTAVATYVFCSVTDSILGLKEVLRVIKPGGNALFIEHVRSENPLIGALMDLVNPLVVHTMGPNINRHTVHNIQQAEFNIEKVEDLGAGGIFKLIVARKSIKLREI
jgi:ubiquinone/menaquinone biosynthesis C-methylase UbiE